MSIEPQGAILAGDADAVARGYERLDRLPVDFEQLRSAPPPGPPRQTTIGRAVSVEGPGTFFRKAQRHLTFEPSAKIQDGPLECTPICRPSAPVKTAWGPVRTQP